MSKNIYTDQELLEALFNLEDKAFEVLYNRIYNSHIIHNLICNNSGNKYDVKDMLPDAISVLFNQTKKTHFFKRRC